ncbi:hypothetical protein H1P_610004 [Hyella patelloides LEGE 07179]|uniref:Uncharacterized protein n=1 Tax=Hyella patelloides LEGE 07179 TaxID=945734 RepID=A0A563W1P1_9CYAN|nr:hypothetical protein H1P_610004 [Hyella patelloides LEGE 07179]
MGDGFTTIGLMLTAFILSTSFFGFIRGLISVIFTKKRS